MAGKATSQSSGPSVHYLSSTQDYCIYYGGDEQNLSLFVSTSNASFSNNTLNQKSYQGYIIKLFGRAVTWRANKQDIVTTSSTETEPLMISQTAKQAIHLSWLMQALNFVFPEMLTIKYDNMQTIRLLVGKSVKLETKLCHVDIFLH